MQQNPPPPSLPEGDPQMMTVLPPQNIQPPTRPGQGCRWFVIGSLGCLTLLLLALAVPIILGVTTANNVIGGIFGIFDPQPRTATVNSTQTLVQGIQPLGQLVSISAQLAKADINVGIASGALNACGFGANHVAQGAVEAGIDLTGVNASSVNYDETTDTYTLRLPAPQLTSCRIDYIRQYERTTTACNVDWDEARLLANYRALLDFRDDSVEGGILTRARLEAELVVRNFVELLTQSNVNIIFDEPTTQVLPPSCTPDIPEGWLFNEQTGQWTKVN
jgi:hypothetical protein